MASFGKQQLSGKFQKAPISPQKSTPPKPAPPQKPKAPFEEKKEWSRYELKRKLTQGPPYIPGTGGKTYTGQERKEMLDKLFPYQRFQSHISEMDAKRRLRELRTEEYKAKTGAEKSELSRKRRYLEEKFGLRGKY